MTVRNPPRGGRGSNQYQSKGAPTERPASRPPLPVLDDDAEDVAWAFHPESAEWTACGFDRVAAHAWMDALGTGDNVTPAECFAYQKWVGGPDTVRWWRQHGRFRMPVDNPPGGPLDRKFADEHTHRRWWAHGFAAGYAAVMHDAGVTPTEAYAWSRAAVFDTDDVFGSHSDRAGRDLATMNAWKDAGITDPGEAGRWHRALNAWNQTDTQVPPSTAARWKEEGFTPAEAALWLRADIGSIGMAVIQRDRGDSPYDYWLRTNPDTDPPVEPFPGLEGTGDWKYTTVHETTGYGWHESAADWHDGDPVVDGWNTTLAPLSIDGESVQLAEYYRDGKLAQIAFSANTLTALTDADKQFQDSPTVRVTTATIAAMTGDPRWRMWQRIAGRSMIAEWVDTGMDPDQAWAWKISGMDNPAWARLYQSHGYEPTDPRPFEYDASLQVSNVDRWLTERPPPLHTAPANLGVV